MTNLSKDDITKQAILEAAGRVFQKWGLNKTTMEDIAKEAGKGKSTLYYYYSSKDEIFDEVLYSEIRRVLKIAEEAINRADTAKEKLRSYTETIFSELKKAANFYNIVVGEIQGRSEPMKKLRANYDKAELSLINGILEFGVQKGEIGNLTKKEMDTIAYVLLNAIRSLQMDLLIENKAGTQEIIDTMLELVSKGLLKF